MVHLPADRIDVILVLLTLQRNHNVLPASRLVLQQIAREIVLVKTLANDDVEVFAGVVTARRERVLVILIRFVAGGRVGIFQLQDVVHDYDVGSETGTATASRVHVATSRGVVTLLQIRYVSESGPGKSLLIPVGLQHLATRYRDFVLGELLTV